MKDLLFKLFSKMGFYKVETPKCVYVSTHDCTHTGGCDSCEFFDEYYKDVHQSGEEEEIHCEISVDGYWNMDTLYLFGYMNKLSYSDVCFYAGYFGVKGLPLSDDYKKACDRYSLMLNKKGEIK